MSNPMAQKPLPSKGELMERIFHLKAALRSSDARLRELLAKQQFFPTAADEALLDNNQALLNRGP